MKQCQICQMNQMYQMESHLAQIQQRIGQRPDAVAIIRGAAEKPAEAQGTAERPARTQGTAERPTRTQGAVDRPAEAQAVAEQEGPCGVVYFFQQENGVLVMADLYRLPVTREHCGGDGDFFGLHIHTCGDCSGTTEAPFENVGGHYNPADCPHPYHAGDLPPVYGTGEGRGFLLCLLDRFMVSKIMGRAVIIHRGHDDFTSQPSGNAGEMIGCGRIIEG